MRVYPVEIGSLQIDLAVTFGVAREIKEKIADPMLIAQEAAIGQRMADAGFTYSPKFSFDVENIPLVIWLGGKATDPALKLSDVQEACCDIGFVSAMQIADGFLAQFIAPRAKEKVEAKGEAKAGE